MEQLQKILNSITLEGAITGIGYSIIATFIVRFLDYLFRGSSSTKKFGSRISIVNTGELIGCFGVLISALFFIFIYVFKSLTPFISIQTLTNIFLVGYGLFIFLHVIHSLKKILKGEYSFVEFMEGLSLMILFTSIAILLILYFKMIIEMWQGWSVEKVDEANEVFRIYWYYLMYATLISGMFSILSKLVGLFFGRKKQRLS